MKSPEAVKAPDAQTEVSVKLLKAHRHAGKEYPSGASISVPQRLLGWLEDNGVIASRQNSQASQSSRSNQSSQSNENAQEGKRP